MPGSAGEYPEPTEFRRWYDEGRTYKWIAEEVFRKYGIRRTPNAYAAKANRMGLPPRIISDRGLVPWKVKRNHRWATPLVILRLEGRRRAGAELSDAEEERLNNWIAALKVDDLVIHYDPVTEQGWWLVPRRPGVDNDIIREPDRSTREH